MKAYIDSKSLCLRRSSPIEHVAGIRDPYWRHETPMPHAAEPDPANEVAVPSTKEFTS